MCAAGCVHGSITRQQETCSAVSLQRRNGAAGIRAPAAKAHLSHRGWLGVRQLLMSPACMQQHCSSRSLQMIAEANLRHAAAAEGVARQEGH
jgi:hypothetical protein